MAQITGADSARNAKIEISLNGTTWTDISGAANTLSVSGGGRTTAETYTFDGDNPLVTIGKSQPADISCTFVYTEGGSDAFATLLPVWENGSDMWIRWWPRGGQTGEFGFTSGPGKLSSFTYPAIDAGTATPTVGGFTLHSTKPAKSVA